MTWNQFFTSSIGKKFIMGFTGLFLITFLVVHAGLNACIFVGEETFNAAGHFMSHNWIMRFLEIGLFVGLILHIIQGISLTLQNNSARPVKYAVSKANRNSKWYSRSMGLLGVLLLLFLIMHLSHFWVDTKKALYFGAEEHSMYGEMREVFTNPLWVVLYLVGLVALFWHLYHGFQSAFQTFGLNNKKFTPIIKCLGTAYSILIVLVFALMPLSFYFGWIS